MIEKISVTQDQVDDLNNIAAFLSVRDVDRLEQRNLYKNFGFRKADVLILLGQSLLFSTNVVADAFRNEAVKKILIVGGNGHSTKFLKKNIKEHLIYKEINTRNKSESELFAEILIKYHGIDERVISLEKNSTNCGDNAEEAYKVISEWDEKPHSIILVQDPTMQMRTFASFKKVWTDQEDVIFINYPSFIPFLNLTHHGLELFDFEIEGLWDLDRLISLLLGEIPRLRDDKNGYGPKGKGYIDHVDIPDHVMASFERLIPVFEPFLNKRKP